MASGRQATKPQQHEAEQDFDPKYEWQENAASFVLRLHLSGRDANLSITFTSPSSSTPSSNSSFHFYGMHVHDWLHFFFWFCFGCKKASGKKISGCKSTAPGA
jgi:hypothetical protein